MGDSYPKRGDYEYIKKKTELTFYDPITATKELVDEVYSITNNRLKAIKIIALAKSAIRNKLGEELNQIKQPTLLVWGNNDTITPLFVAREFNKLIPNSELYFVDKCGHAPMMEVPDEFNAILHKFLKKLNEPATGIFNKALQGFPLSPLESAKYKSAIQYELAVMDWSRGWVQQFHLGAIRNNNSRLLKTLGKDIGVDSIGDYLQIEAMSKFFDRLDQENKLTKTIIYNVNPVFMPHLPLWLATFRMALYEVRCNLEWLVVFGSKRRYDRSNKHTIKYGGTVLLRRHDYR